MVIGAASLNQFTAVWFHYEQANTLPVIAANKNVTNVIKGYYSNGGNIFLSGTACLYTGSLGITPAAYTPNNAFGSFGDAGQVNAPGELWGIAITGCEEHPIYKGVTIDKTTQSWPVVWLVGKEISWRRNIGCPWDLVAPYTQDWADWASKTGGTPLASFNWDDDCTGGCKSIWYTGTSGLFGNDESRECIFTDICIYWKCSFTVCFPKSWCKEKRTYQKRISCCTGVRFMFCSSCFYSY